VPAEKGREERAAGEKEVISLIKDHPRHYYCREMRKGNGGCRVVRRGSTTIERKGKRGNLAATPKV